MSALDGRIRTIAREEAAAVLADGPAAGAQEAGGDAAQLRAEVEALTIRVEALEKAPSLSEQVSKASARRSPARKESSE
jgi:hypothetical protein